jgi:YVTN family beta-propeller protein
MAVQRSTLLLLGLAACSCSMGSEDAGDEPRIYVTNETSGDVSIIDPSTREVLDTVLVGQRPRGIAAGPGERLLYVALSGSPIGGPGVDESTLPQADKSQDAIGVFDVRAGRIVKRFRGVSDPEAVVVSPDGKRLYVASEDTGQLVIMDAENGRILAQLPVGGEPEGVAVSPDGKLVYVTSEEEHTVAVVDTERDRVRALVPVGSRPRNAVFSRDGSRAWVPGENDATVSLIDVARDTVIAKVSIGGEDTRPMGIVISPNGKHLYVTTGRGGELVRLDPETLRVTGRAKAGERPWGVAITPDGRWLLTANGPSNDVSVVDARTMRTVGRIASGGRPWGAIAVGGSAK